MFIIYRITTEWKFEISLKFKTEARISIESLSKRRFRQHGRQPEVRCVVIDGEWWRQPFLFEINNGSQRSTFTFMISNENGWRPHSPSITTQLTSGCRPCWQKCRLLKLSNERLSTRSLSCLYTNHTLFLLFLRVLAGFWLFVYWTINASDYLTISIITGHNGLLDSLWRIVSSTIYCVHANLKLLSFFTLQKFIVFTLNDATVFA